jgi:hypothetical protein
MSQQQKHTGIIGSVRLARWGIHWKVPTTMLSSYFVVVLLAVGNHLFYSALDGKIATHQSVSNIIKSQLAVGNCAIYKLMYAI